MCLIIYLLSTFTKHLQTPRPFPRHKTAGTKSLSRAEVSTSKQMTDTEALPGKPYALSSFERTAAGFKKENKS